MLILSTVMLTRGSAKDKTPLTTLLLQLELPADVGCPESMALAHILLRLYRVNSDAAHWRPNTSTSEGQSSKQSVSLKSVYIPIFDNF